MPPRCTTTTRRRSVAGLANAMRGIAVAATARPTPDFNTPRRLSVSRRFAVVIGA